MPSEESGIRADVSGEAHLTGGTEVGTTRAHRVLDSLCFALAAVSLGHGGGSGCRRGDDDRVGWPFIRLAVFVEEGDSIWSLGWLRDWDSTVDFGCTIRHYSAVLEWVRIRRRLGGVESWTSPAWG